jgi:serine phosphatase RsbU (regulator of sigma subunit)
VNSINIPVISDAYDHWLESKKVNSDLFEYESNGEHWWGKLIEYKLSEGNNLIVGVVIPESDILSEVQRTKRVIIGSFVFLLILTGFVLYSYGQSKIVNRILAGKNDEINEQRLLIQEKNDEIVDSINYAKRIQSAILPPESEFKEFLPNSFILYKPKAIVAGDFYWLEHKNDSILFAAADCTGHGVPGAMVSVVCKNALSRAVREYNETVPGLILDRTRDIVIEEFKKSKEELKDGMDIALCALTGNTLQYSGAHNPLWIVRKGSEEIEEIKADKQPIGRFDAVATFTTHTVELNRGDTFYIFSDGFADQFGGIIGKKYKAANFKKLLNSIQHYSMEDQKIQIDEVFENWKGDLDQLDDVCVIGVKI